MTFQLDSTRETKEWKDPQRQPLLSYGRIEDEEKAFSLVKQQNMK